MSWDDEDFEVPTTAGNAKVADSWEDEFADEDEPLAESWDAEEEEKPKPKPKPAAAAAPKAKPAANKKKTLVSGGKVSLDKVDEKTRKELQRKAEQDSDLNNAADLFGGLGVSEHPRERAAREAAALQEAQPTITADTPIDAHPLFQPETKQDYAKLRKALAPALVKLNDQSSLNYSSSLAIDLIRDLSKPLSTENIRKVISTLNVLSKEKEREERQARLAKSGGTATGGAGKKKNKTARPNLGGAFKKDNDIDVSYDNFGDDDFM